MTRRYLATGTVALAMILAHPNRGTFAFDGQDVIAGYTITTWTGTNGFGFGDTNAIAQDRRGYLWLGTSLGLVRFDGVQFEPLNLEGIPPSTLIFALAVAHDGSMWAGLPAGVVRIRNDRATMYTEREGFGGGFVTRIVVDADTIWTSGSGGVWRFRNDRWERVGTDQGLPSRASRALFIDPDRALWAATPDGIFRRDPSQDRFQHATTSSGSVEAFVTDAAGSLWATDPVRTLTPVLHNRALPHWPAQGFGAANDALRDRRGYVWVATSGQGLLRIPPPADARASLSLVTQEDGLATNSIRALLEDREGNLWVGMAGGLARLSEKSVSTIAQGEAVSALATTRDGSLWIGTNSGLIRVVQGRQLRYAVQDGLPSAAIRALHTDSQDRLWVATSRGPARWIAGRFVPLALPQGFALQRITALVTDPMRTLWMGDLDDGLFRLTGETLNPVSGPPLQPLTTVYADTQGRIWLGQLQGALDSYADGRFEHYDAPDWVRAGSVNAIHQDSDGVMWIGWSTGLGRLEDGRLIQVKNEHVASGVLAFVEGHDDQLWLATRAGILRANRGELRGTNATSDPLSDYRVYDAADGLPGLPTRAFPGGVLSNDRSIWFGTVNGAANIALRDLRASRQVPELRVERVVADDRSIRPDSDAVLPAGTSRIEIQYALVSLNPPSTTRFAYRLDGYDSDWVTVGTRREALYTNLPPGPYRFRVATLGGTGSRSEAVWDFSVEPRFYQTTAFAVAALLAVGAILSAAWRLRLLRLKQQFKIVLNERVRIAREIHDTLLQGLAGVAVQLDGISRQAHLSPEATRDRLDKVRSMVGHYIRETRSSIWLLRSHSAEEAGLPVTLRDAAEHLVAGTPLHLKFDVIGRVTEVSSRVQYELLRIANEAIVNALKHSKGRELRVTLQYDPTSVCLRVADDGQGVEGAGAEATDAATFGLIGMKERAEEIGAVLKVSSEKGRGTEVQVVVAL